jgi:endonuclease SegE-like protein
MSNWKFKNRTINSIEDIPEGVVGFIYEIVNLTKKAKGEEPFKYIGKKLLYSETTKIISKKEKLETGNNRKKKKKVVKESNWLLYTGSNDPLNLDIANGDKIQRTILEYTFSKRSTTYLEQKYLFVKEVLEKNEYYNICIGYSFFKGNLL